MMLRLELVVQEVSRIGGNYLDLCTGLIGIGNKVSKEIIRTYIERYEVEANHLQKLFEVEWPESNMPPSISKRIGKN
jgi:hypothetical protein